METKTDFGVNYLEGTQLRDGLRAIWQNEHKKADELAREWTAQGLEQVYFVGCGGSRAIMEPVKWLLDRFCPLPADAYTGWEFVTRAPRRLNNQSIVILASHSGTTEEVLKGLELAKSRGAHTVSFSVEHSPLSNGAAISMTYNTRAVNLAKLYLAYIVTASLLVYGGIETEGKRLLGLLEALPDKLQRVIELTETRGRQLASEYKDAKGFYVVGSGPLAGLAYQFQVCSLMEMQWLHASAINAGEFRHGPYEIVDEGLPMIFLLGTDETRPVVERAYQFAERHGARVIRFDLKELDGIDAELAPFGVHIGLQWFLWYLAQEHNHPITTRRYMGKVPY